jgi:hypothetical protein
VDGRKKGNHLLLAASTSGVERDVAGMALGSGVLLTLDAEEDEEDLRTRNLLLAVVIVALLSLEFNSISIELTFGNGCCLCCFRSLLVADVCASCFCISISNEVTCGLVFFFVFVFLIPLFYLHEQKCLHMLKIYA